jgi:hypothetical protein
MTILLAVIKANIFFSLTFCNKIKVYLSTGFNTRPDFENGWSSELLPFS